MTLELMKKKKKKIDGLFSNLVEPTTPHLCMHSLVDLIKEEHIY